MSPDELLDALALERDEAARELWFERLIARFPAEELAEPVRRRIERLGGPDGPILLRLVEWVRSPAAYAALADRIRSDPSLPADQEWLALTLLGDSGRLDDDPELIERLAEFDDMMADDAIADDLAVQIRDDADRPWMALEGLDRVEPDVRAEIIGELGRRADEPGVEELLRLLGHAHDPTTGRRPDRPWPSAGGRRALRWPSGIANSRPRFGSWPPRSMARDGVRSSSCRPGRDPMRRRSSSATCSTA
ncbi:MAG: hypothetical protein U0800_11990 [Isosphaeraceae bacterium]